MAKNIVLIGLMGSGKSTVGKMLADQLSYSFKDTDCLIENSAKLTINEIFAKFGEEYFRNLETETTKELINQQNLIISTGGGIVERSENFDYLKSNSIIFYLYAASEELFKRIKDSDNRPLLNNPDPEKTLSNLLQKREKFYNLADVKIETTGKSPETIVKEIIEHYESRNS